MASRRRRWTRRSPLASTIPTRPSKSGTRSRTLAACGGTLSLRRTRGARQAAALARVGRARLRDTARGRAAQRELQSVDQLARPRRHGVVGGRLAAAAAQRRPTSGRRCSTTRTLHRRAGTVRHGATARGARSPSHDRRPATGCGDRRRLDERFSIVSYRWLATAPIVDGWAVPSAASWCPSGEGKPACPPAHWALVRSPPSRSQRVPVPGRLGAGEQPVGACPRGCARARGGVDPARRGGRRRRALHGRRGGADDAPALPQPSCVVCMRVIAG